jgi:hypothetical protein
MKTSRIGIGVTLLAAALALAACGGGGDSSSSTSDTSTGIGGGESALPAPGGEPSNLNPADFTTEISNPYWPMRPGDKWVYRETDANGKVVQDVVTVTNDTKTIANGIEARVLRDVVSDHGEPVEVTDDWYAQDKEGNVWYLGEDTAEYQNGKVATREGSFEASVDGAQPGVIMPAHPAVGQEYRQEFYKGHAEDSAKIVGLGEAVTVPFGKFADTVKTEDTAPLDDPPAVENKFYARSIGPVETLGISGSEAGSSEVLVSYTPGA